MKVILKIFITVLILASMSSAATLTEYRENISHLKDDLSTLLDPDSRRTDEEEQFFINEVFEELATLFPSKQKIEWQGGTIETDNAWLVNKFSSFKDLKKDAPERRQLLSEIYERLEAVEQKIKEYETADISERTKDEEKQKLSEILKREEYARPEEPKESAIAAAYRRFKEWLKSLFPEPEPQERVVTPVGSSVLPFILQILIYGLLIGLIGFLIYKFAPFIAARIKHRERKEKRERIILGEKIAADETSAHLFGDAERLAREGDLRGAIRKGYIALLCDLSDRKVIGLSKNKTNRDYLRDVRKRRELFQSMNGLTNNFERHWYGAQEADQSDWDEFREGYQKAIRSS